MTRGRPLTFATSVFLLEVLPLAAAHGDDHDNGSVEMIMDVSNAPQSYWSLTELSSLMYWHVGIEVLAWLVVLPVGVMLSIARSRLALPFQFVFLFTNTFALLLGIVYKRRTPDLYENNAHSKTGWIVTWVASAWVFMALIQVYSRRRKACASEGHTGDQLNAVNIARYQRVHNAELPSPSGWSNDSGQGIERNSASLYSHCRSPSVESEEQRFTGQSPRYSPAEEDDFDDDAEKRGSLKHIAVDRFFRRRIALFAVGKASNFLRLFNVMIERTLLVQGFVAIASGTVVYGGIGHGGALFNVLAHYVKGGIFFGYGLLTLGRWMGAFADLGWAWNIKPPMEVVGRRRAAIPSAEFTESLVIFLYGCSNVFMEHLAAWGDAWTAQDLEHVSISVMFFGGGLLGMIVESSRIRELLNNAVVSAQPPSQYHDERWDQPRQYRFSMNPMPGLIILLLGKMMSSHHQASMLSTMIHSQWGSMFMGFALCRALTYITLYISPPTSYLPSRPPTEVITSFCLIAGGLTFMVSNKDTVAALESYNLDAMFTFTVTMGLVALLMAWSVVLIAIKGWAQRRTSASRFTKNRVAIMA